MTQIKQPISPISDEQIRQRAQQRAQEAARAELERERQQALQLMQQQQRAEANAQNELQQAARSAFDAMEESYRRRDAMAAQLAPMLKELAALTISIEAGRRRALEDMQRAGVDMDRLGHAVANHRVPFVSKLSDVDRDAAAWAATFVGAVVVGAVAWGVDDSGRVTSMVGPAGHQLIGHPLG